MLDIVMRWHSAKEIFDEECVGFPGFVTKFRVATNKEDSSSPGTNDASNHVDYENYRWKKIFLNFTKILFSKEVSFPLLFLIC